MSRQKKNRRAEQRGYLPSAALFSSIPLSGIMVTPETAMSWLPFYCAISVISNNIATLPLHVFQRLSRGKQPAYAHPVDRLVTFSPDDEIHAMTWRRTKTSHVLTYGNAYSEIERSFTGHPIALHLMAPKNVKPVRNKLGKIEYELKEQGVCLPSRNCLHFANISGDALVGASPVAVAREAIGYGLGIERYGAAFYGNSAEPGGIIEVPGKLDKQAISNLRESFENKHRGVGNSSRIAIMQNGMKWIANGFSPRDSEFIAGRSFQITEVARLFSIPPHMLADLTRATFSNIEEQNIQFATYTLRPWLSLFEAEMNFKLMEYAQPYYLDHDMSEFMRGNLAARTAFYKDMESIGVLSPNEIRDREDLNPVDGGDEHFVPLNMITLDAVVKGKTVEPSADSPVQPSDVQTVPSDVAQVEDVQATALNGAQIVSLLQTVQAVASGLLPPDAAKAVIAASFPSLTPAQIDAMLDPLLSFTPASVQPVEPTPAPIPPAPRDDARDAAKASVADAVGRMVRREVTSLRRIAGKSDYLAKVSALDEFYKRHSTIVREALEPHLATYRTVTGNAVETDAFMRLVMGQDVVSQMIADDTLANLDGLLDSWESSKAETVMESL